MQIATTGSIRLPGLLSATSSHARPWLEQLGDPETADKDTKQTESPRPSTGQVRSPSSRIRSGPGEMRIAERQYWRSTGPSAISTRAIQEESQPADVCRY